MGAGKVGAAPRAEMQATILVVDDRAEVRSLIAGDLEDAGLRVVQAKDGVEAWSTFRRDEPDLVVTDLRMPRSDGIELLRCIRSISSVPVILLTAYADVPTAVAAMKGGAQEFFTFPDDLERMVERVRAIIAAQSGAERDWLEERVVGKSAAMRRVRERIRAVAPLRVPVLVIGEQGSGRDSVVEAVQAASEHNDAPLARFPSGTGGQPKLPTKPSVYYLDQVEKLTPLEQAYWFDLLREGIPRANPPILRVLASSGSDLGVQIREAGFHRRLADQLLRFTIGLVPLRDRIDDIAQLAPLLANRVGRRIGREEIRLDRGALTLLKAQQWQDNVRELESVVEKLVAFSSTGVITRDHVQQILGESPDNVSSLRSRRSEKQREELIELLEACGGNLAEVARRLEISRGAVIYRAQKYGLMPRPR